MHVARAAALGPVRPELLDKRSSGLPRRTRELIETFAPLAEGATLGPSQVFACTRV